MREKGVRKYKNGTTYTALTPSLVRVDGEIPVASNEAYQKTHSHACTPGGAKWTTRTGLHIANEYFAHTHRKVLDMRGLPKKEYNGHPYRKKKWFGLANWVRRLNEREEKPWRLACKKSNYYRLPIREKAHPIFWTRQKKTPSPQGLGGVSHQIPA